MHIPEELSNLPTHIAEIFLAGVAPSDKENIWNHCATTTARDWHLDCDARSYIIGKVSFYTQLQVKNI